MSAEEEAVAAPQGPPSMGDRLAGVCIDVRSDLEVSRHVFRGVPHYVLRDPVSFGSHRFSLEDYRIVTHLKSDRTLGETFEQLVADELLDQEDSERYYQFVFGLHKLNLLHLPISDEKTLYERYESRRKAKRKQMAKSVLFFRVPLFTPDGLLARTMPYVQPFFTRTAFVLWTGLIALAGLVVVRNWEAFAEPVGNIFRNDNLPLLWITLVGLKVVHEFGHAYATKAFGGHVPEMGLFVMLFTPCAYVDASAAWGFTRKRERIIVCLAGMYVELFVAALCVLAWSVMAPGLWRSVMHNAVMLASVITIGFNINPLMRFDGYYALSDALEIPNMRARAQVEGLALLKRCMLGIKSQAEATSLFLKAFLVSFGVAGGIYKITLVLGISATIAMKFPVVGLLMGGLYLFGEILSVVKRCIPFLWRSEETADRRAWAMTLSVLLMGGVPAALMGVPVPVAVTTRAVLAGENEVFLRAGTTGFVEAIHGIEGSRVEAGQTIVQLSDPNASARLVEIESRLDAARIKLSTARNVDPALAAKEEVHVRQLEKEARSRREDLAKLTIVTPLGGTLANSLDEPEIGRYVQLGEPIGMVIGGREVVRALLTEEELAATRPSPGLAVEFRSVADPDRLLKGRITRVAPLGRREFDQSFSRFLDPEDYAVNPATGKAARSLFEVEVLLHGASERLADRQGLRGKLRITGDSEPFGARLMRKARTFLRHLTS